MKQLTKHEARAVSAALLLTVLLTFSSMTTPAWASTRSSEPTPVVATTSGTSAEPTTTTTAPRSLPLLIDQADLLTNEEQQKLDQHLEALSFENRCDIVVLTVNRLNGKTPRDYADDFFDQNNYGQGSDKTGILLLISMEERDFWVSTSGRAYTQLTENRSKTLMSGVTSKLSTGDYYDAFVTFADNAANLMNMPAPATQIDSSTSESGMLPEEVVAASGISPAEALAAGLVSLAGGALSALAITTGKKKKHQTVQAAIGAANYLVDKQSGVSLTEEARAQQTASNAASSELGAAVNVAVNFTASLFRSRANGSISSLMSQAFNLTAQSDNFLYENLQVTPIPKDTDSSSGDSGGFGGHVSGGGATHGGFGGKF